MSRFSSFFRQLRALDQNSSLPLFFYALILFAILAYVLPWVHNPGQALTLGGYDLAEWLSLHAGVRFQSPPLLASGLIRLHLVLLSALVVIWMPRRSWPMTLVFVVVLVIAQLPPPEFVSQSGDMNYRQQLGLTITTLILCGGLWGLGWRALPTLIIAGTGVVLCFVGLSQALKFMQDFRLSPTVGMGAALLVAAYGMMIGLILTRLRFVETQRAQQVRPQKHA